jgi:hypothetical protein
MRLTTALFFAAGALLVLLLEGLALASWQGWIPRRHAAHVPHMKAAPQTQAAAIDIPEQIAEPEVPERPVDAYYRELRSQVRWVPTRLGNEVLFTPDMRSRMLLAKSAAKRARLDEVGLGFADVYGIINAESSWVPRDGMSRDGTPNLGIAQFEPATAAALGVRDPHDVVEAVHAAAEHMREAAAWSAARLSAVKLSKSERAARLRDGVSIYYNLSSRGRTLWDGRDISRLPAATQSHIRNARQGAQEATWLEAQGKVVQARRGRTRSEALVTAEAAP